MLLMTPRWKVRDRLRTGSDRQPCTGIKGCETMSLKIARGQPQTGTPSFLSGTGRHTARVDRFLHCTHLDFRHLPPRNDCYFETPRLWPFIPGLQVARALSLRWFAHGSEFFS